MLSDFDFVNGPIAPIRKFKSAGAILEHPSVRNAGLLGSERKRHETPQELLAKIRRKEKVAALLRDGGAAIKLERMPLSVLRSLLAVLWLIALLCAVISVAFSLTSFAYSVAEYDSTTINNESSFALFIILYSVDGVLRSIGVLILFWLLLSYPQRILVDSIRFKRMPLAEQIVICVVIVAMSILPAYSVYGLIEFWFQFSYGVSKSNTQAVWLLLYSIIALDNLSDAAIYLDRIMTVVVLSLIYFYVGGIAFFQAHAHGWDVKGLLEPTEKEKELSEEEAGEESG